MEEKCKRLHFGFREIKINKREELNVTSKIVNILIAEVLDLFANLLLQNDQVYPHVIYQPIQ